MGDILLNKTVVHLLLKYIMSSQKIVKFILLIHMNDLNAVGHRELIVRNEEKEVLV